MVFSTIFFLFYFLPAFFVLFFLAPAKLKNYVALLGSLVFYAVGAPKFIFVLLASTLADFILAKTMDKSEGRKRQYWLWVGIILNVSLLLYFKYANFFIHNANRLLHHFHHDNIAWIDVALPIGISFFTFHKLSYLIDVYRKKDPVLNKITDYFLYILLFPQLIAGPIIRYHEISAQIANRPGIRDRSDDILSGILRFILGLSKKVLIANVLGQQADIIFSTNINELTSFYSWVGILAYTFQIYFDFSGYSDMAIGLGKMMGFTFPENFNNPYISQSITEFWRRWHISLSSWMKDYLYIPLGGNKKEKARMYLNLWVVFLISGIWHGAAWNFIAWGIFHGMLLILDRIFLLRTLHFAGKPFRVLFTFLLVMVGWVFFRSASLHEAFAYLKIMFSFKGTPAFEWLDAHFILTLFFASIASFIWMIPDPEKTQIKWFNTNTGTSTLLVKSMLSMAALLLCIFELSVSGFNPFIYFRF